MPADGVELLAQHLGYLPDEYKMGRTKIFIRHPRTLYATEDAYEKCKHDLGKFNSNLKNFYYYYLRLIMVSYALDLQHQNFRPSIKDTK